MIAGLDNPYMEIAQEWLQHAYRPATQGQHSYIIRLYTGLALKLGLDPMHPTEELAISFTTFLACNFKTQKSVRSMQATLVACLERAGINTQSFQLHSASLLSRSISINKRTQTLQRPPVDTRILQRIVAFWRRYEDQGQMLSAAALLMFTTSVRQSNIFPSSQKLFDTTRQLTCADVEWRPDYFKLNIKWGKAQQKVCTKYQKIPRASAIDLCTYTALGLIPRPSSIRRSTPLISFPDGKPVPISYMTRKWNSALQALGLSSTGFTLHSLRLGGARFLQDHGVEVNHIASHAGWRSAAINDYVNAPGTKQAYKALHALA